MALFTKFHKGTLPLHSLNFGTIILLSKGNDVKQIQQYRPIYVVESTNRVVKIAARVIEPTQTSFLPGHFEKAYDKVRSVQQALRMKGFHPTWCTWVQTCIQEGNIGIKVNDQTRCLRQGDPLSPILFNIVVDVLAIIVSRAKVNSQIKWVVLHLGEDGIPMHFRKLNSKDWKMIEERIEKKLSNWKGKMLSFGERLVPLNSVVSSLPMLMISFFEIPRGKKKTKRLTFLEKSYGSKRPIPKLGRFKLVSGNQIRFWEDIWLDNQSLKNIYPNLFNIARRKYATVAEVLSTAPFNISFRRALVGNKLIERQNPVARIANESS
ncbi:hypothetical protein U9M48_022480 [Paspalum notatum var. saurae]|uniref:Reverse transcriptase domain-containing protein n=1 Tax=Paspalum notatum var. saurae TaxID=547442 RepID=A0AAQ3TIA5_PASNO